MELSKKIKEMRLDKKLTQEDLARACYVTRSTISNWEAGRRKPDWENLVIIADLFGVSVEELLEKKKSNTNKIEENTAISKNSRKKLIIFSIFKITLAIFAITFLTLTILPIIRNKQNEFTNLLMENVEGLSLQIESNEGVELHQFKEIKLLENNNSTYKVYQLNDLLIDNSKFSKYQYCLEKIFIFDIIVQQKSTRYKLNNNSIKFNKIESKKNAINLLSGVNLPFITTAGMYDIVIYVSNISYYIGAYLK